MLNVAALPLNDLGDLSHVECDLGYPSRSMALQTHMYYMAEHQSY